MATKEVYFNEYCDKCKYFKTSDAEDHCDSCLDEPGNEDSHKPVNFKEAET